MLVNGTTYDDRTPAEVVKILEESRASRRRLVVVTGSLDTGEPELDRPERGFVGRSCGSIKVPLLIKTSRSMGGEPISDRIILELRESKGGRVLYRRGQS